MRLDDTGLTLQEAAELLDELNDRPQLIRQIQAICAGQGAKSSCVYFLILR
jgi:hypothetical protein